MVRGDARVYDVMPLENVLQKSEALEAVCTPRIFGNIIEPLTKHSTSANTTNIGCGATLSISSVEVIMSSLFFSFLLKVDNNPEKICLFAHSFMIEFG